MIKLIYKLFPKLRTLVEQFKQLPPEQDPRIAFGVWLLDVIQYGVAGSIVAIIFFGRLSWNNVVPLTFAIGIGRWLILDFVKSLKRRMVE